MRKTSGAFTLPGEAGYEELTLRLAKKWGADVIRDSDGTKLSDEIVNAGYGIYSTICMIRDHNEWARQHREQLQQTFLMTAPMVAELKTMPGDVEDGMAPSCSLEINLLETFYKEQFVVNDTEESIRYWQVFDRTSNEEVMREHWAYVPARGTVTVRDAAPDHLYTVNFLAYRIWEEISMYNHVTNHWDKDHLMPVDPRSGEAQEYLYNWLKAWCENNPDTTVVRFTSMFYNFVWIWGADERNRNRFSDWGSYDFTVSPQALEAFEQAYGYGLTSEDFINMGNLHVTHMEPTKKLLDYIAFTNRFVVEYGKRLVELVHSYGKQAYVFYDDSWVGIEPYLPSFQEFGFDGIIKCIFSGYEVRLCAGVDVPVHEVRLHPYLFPVGLGGAPTFSGDGNPVLDAKRYWNAARRAMLRCKIDRIGLGGYLHLVEPYPDFVDYIETVAEEFRMIRSLQEQGSAHVLDLKVAVLTAWGKMRSWTLSGHFHETYMHDLIHVNEALSGLPVRVDYICFDDIRAGRAAEYDVIINAGFAGSAWSGGSNWKDDEVVTALTRWVRQGGVYLGIHQPSMVDGYMHTFRMAHVLGVDLDTGARCCHGKPAYVLDKAWKRALLTGMRCGSSSLHGDKRSEEEVELEPVKGIWLTDANTKVVAELVEKNPIGEAVHTPTATVHEFGKGKGVYLSHLSYSVQNSRMLLNLMLLAAGKGTRQNYLCDNAWCECAYFQESGVLAVMNLSEEVQKTVVGTNVGERVFELEPFGVAFEEL